jgi:hypothetical protein
MEKINFYIETNDFENCIKQFEELEEKEFEVKSLINNIIEENSIYLLNILLYVSYKKNVSFWYNITGYALSFYLSHLEGAERTALLMFKKSFELNPNDIIILKAILDFYNLPEKVLSNEEYEYYSKILINKFE